MFVKNIDEEVLDASIDEFIRVYLKGLSEAKDIVIHLAGSWGEGEEGFIFACEYEAVINGDCYYMSIVACYANNVSKDRIGVTLFIVQSEKSYVLDYDFSDSKYLFAQLEVEHEYDTRRVDGKTYIFKLADRELAQKEVLIIAKYVVTRHYNVFAGGYMKQTETTWDKLLRIKTTGRDDSRADQYNYPYEPTSYAVLERLAQSGFIKKRDILLDYGCGKGRVDFFLAYQTKAHTIGIEYDERMYEKALENCGTAVSAARTEWVLGKAEAYEVPVEVNRCYFFNPFSVEIFQKVIARIIDSYYANPREMLLFFYYPSSEYVAYLMTINELEFVDDIDCSDISHGEKTREKIIVFRMGF